jgi:chaperonin GroEL
MKTTTTKIVEQTFKEIRNGVVPTMGAKGRLAVIQDEFSRPILTDDGVTVAKEFLNQEDTFKKMVALSMIEASANTEKTAFDGTTLTVLLTDEFYKEGVRQIKKGKHPQVVADTLAREADRLRIALLNRYTYELTEEGVKDLAYLTTKMPLVGDLVYKAYKHAGKDMDIIIEHDRKEKENTIEHINGMVLDAGYFSETLKSKCNEGDKTVFEDAALVILSEGMLTPIAVREFFESIPADKFNSPFVFIIHKSFNPETLKILMDVLVQNNMLFQIVFINEERPEELFLDIAARTGGQIQDATLGTTNYRYEYCGYADKITIEQDKTTIINECVYKEAIDLRLAAYDKELKENEYTTGYNRQNVITRRKANLNAGVTKIKLACPTVTEYMTIRLKLDDAIGAVKCALKHGVVLGGGKALWLLSKEFPLLKKALQSPMKTIVKNAGYKMPKQKVLMQKVSLGLDVKTGMLLDLKVHGIMDSFDSVDKAIQNAMSIATQYLRTYILIKKA